MLVTVSTSTQMNGIFRTVTWQASKYHNSLQLTHIRTEHVINRQRFHHWYDLNTKISPISIHNVSVKEEIYQFFTWKQRH